MKAPPPHCEASRLIRRRYFGAEKRSAQLPRSKLCRLRGRKGAKGPTVLQSGGIREGLKKQECDLAPLLAISSTILNKERSAGNM